MGIICEKDFIERVKSFNETSYKAGEREKLELLDSHDDRYLKSGDFKANLHIHTQYSDGIMTVPDLIKRTSEIPDMLTAITDHDTVEGAKELLNLNPKNADICAGIEISTIATKFPKQPKPLPIHVLVYGIDPFDKKLNEFLDYKRDAKLKLAQETIDELNNTLPEYDFSLEEAAKCHPMITKGQDEIAHPLKKYTSAKIILNYYFPNADFSYEEPIFKFKHLFKGTEPYHITYKIALQMFTNCTLPLVPDFINEKVKEARKIYLGAHPKIGEDREEFCMFEQTLDFVSKLDSGVMSIAHPARTKAYTPEFYNYLFYNFKKYGKEKAMFYEKYYQSYEDRYFIEWSPVVDNAAEGLLPTGGYDSHGGNITSRSSHY